MFLHNLPSLPPLLVVNDYLLPQLDPRVPTLLQYLVNTIYVVQLLLSNDAGPVLFHFFRTFQPTLGHWSRNDFRR